MPTYEYECSKCSVFEEFQSISAPPLKKCPTCGRKVKRLLGTGAGLLFKGGGFYITDYRSENYKSGSKKESSAESPAKSEKKSPEKATPTKAASA